MRTIDGVTISSLMIKSIRTLGDKITTLVNGTANEESKMKKIQDLIKVRLACLSSLRPGLLEG